MYSFSSTGQTVSISPFALGKVQTFELPTGLYQQTHIQTCPGYSLVLLNTTGFILLNCTKQLWASKGPGTLQRWSTKRDTTPAVRANPALSVEITAVVSELILKLNLAFTVMQNYNGITMRLTINRNKPSMSTV